LTDASSAPERREDSEAQERVSSGGMRLSAHQIYDRVVADARSELNRTTVALAFSGFAAGLFMGLTGLGVAGARAVLPGQAGEFIGFLFYPLGFIAVVVGRAQLFTENTLFPVVLILEERRHLLATARLWLVVLVANVLGALAFAALAGATGALHSAAVNELVQLGVQATDPPLVFVFTSAIVGGWLIALMSWLVSGAQRTMGQIAVIWLVTFPVGMLHLAHCIASSGYILVATVHGNVAGGVYAAWLGAATAGNVVGGVGIVSMLNYGQVRVGTQLTRRRRLRLGRNENVFRRLVRSDGQEPGQADELKAVDDFVCECANRNCDVHITMTLDEYRRMRDQSNRLAVISGHQQPEVEPAIEHHDDHLVVERLGIPSRAVQRSRLRRELTKAQPRRR
jgi:formate/nitrite transporter FocA (FNT family)